MVLFGAGTPATPRPPAGCCSSPTPRSRRAVHGRRRSSTTRPAPATSASCPPLRGGWRRLEVVTRARGRRRWPACRSAPGSSPRSSPTTRSATPASAARAVVLAASWPGRCSPSRTRRGSTGARSSRPGAAPGDGRPSAARHRRGRSSRPPRSWRWSAWSSASRPAIADGWRPRRSRATGRRSRPVHLALWHGFGVPLALSVAHPRRRRPSLLARRPMGRSRVLAWGGAVPSGAEVYLATLRGARRGVGPGHRVRAERLAAGLRRRDPRHRGGPSRRRAARRVGLAGLAGVRTRCARRRSRSSLVVAALGAAIVRRRFSAAVFLGVAGYAMAGLFVLSGAPDLALTQVAVETLSTVVFVLVLRRLPERFERQSTSRRRVVRLAHRRRRSAPTVFVFALVAAGVRLQPTGVGRDGGAVGARRPRPQRRERDPRRLPRLRHARRDHGARRRVDRRGGARPGRPAGRRAARRPSRRADRPTCGASRSSTCRCSSCSTPC